MLKPRGDFAAVQLGTATPGTHVLHASVPAGGRVVALRLAYPPIAAFLAGHRESGTTLSVSNASRGVLKLGPPFSSWIGTGGVRVDDGGIHYLVNRAAVSLLRPKQPTDGVPVPVLATPALAALGDVVSLTVNDAPLTVQVVGRMPLVPSVDGDAIVADRDRVVDGGERRTPGSAARERGVGPARATRRGGAARARSARPPRRRVARGDAARAACGSARARHARDPRRDRARRARARARRPAADRRDGPARRERRAVRPPRAGRDRARAAPLPARARGARRDRGSRRRPRRPARSSSRSSRRSSASPRARRRRCRRSSSRSTGRCSPSASSRSSSPRASSSRAATTRTPA